MSAASPDSPASGLDAVPGMDPAACRRWWGLPRQGSPWLHEEVGNRMAERLQWFRQQPQSWLNWEPVVGGLEVHRALRQRLAQATCFVHSAQPQAALSATREAPESVGWTGFWRRREPGGPARAEPGTTVQMLWANMALHAQAHPQATIRQWHRHVEVDGFLMFSCLGPDSLSELRALYADRGWAAPSHSFTDMHDWGDMLVGQGFAEPVMDMERITLSYSSPAALLDELRSLGRNLSSGRQAGLRGRTWRRQLEQAIETGLPRGPDGRLLLTFEVIYGHAFKAPPRIPVSSSTQVAVDDMRAMLRAPRR
ncbi:biotin synthase [uncultured Hydrogenophaga sp.]|uniref:biotin synthase n=1 Tax=uncultured Hydrogenophaga sp. TaxID=199683 RepID=UPI00265F2538|nr:biotin synthase [uncultured Hydrogenophaga sp.]